MTHTRENQGVCSYSTAVTIQDGIIQDVQVQGGCNGNLQGIAALLVGRPAAEAAATLQGITCGGRPTSCPDQIAQAIAEALAKGE